MIRRFGPTDVLQAASVIAAPTVLEEQRGARWLQYSHTGLDPCTIHAMGVPDMGPHKQLSFFLRRGNKVC